MNQQKPGLATPVKSAKAAYAGKFKMTQKLNQGVRTNWGGSKQVQILPVSQTKNEQC